MAKRVARELSEEVSKERPNSFSVEALREGYYGHRRRKPGARFQLFSKAEFSPLWMKAINFEPPALTPTQKKLIESPDHKFKFKDMSTLAVDKVVYPGLVEEKKPVKAQDDEDVI